MNKTKVIALSILGIVVPVALAFSAYAISRNTIGSAGTVPFLMNTPGAAASIDAGTPNPSPTRRPDGTAKPTVDPAPSPQVTITATDDHSGKCSEPEHTADPSCGSGGSSGSGSGGGGGDDSSPNSGHGSGDD